MKKKEWKVDKNGRRWFRHPNSDRLWVPVTKTYSDDVVRERKKCTLDQLVSRGMIGMLKYTADCLMSVLQSEGLTDNAWEELAKLWEIADIAWDAKCNGRNLSHRPRAAQRRRDS
jgi:hypothetical protein